MYRKKIFSCIMTAILLSTFLACSSQNMQADSNGSDIAQPSESVDNSQLVEPEEIKKEFSFASVEEVKNISDDDLVMIAYGDYRREDFFGEDGFATVDLFDVPMMVPTEEEPENTYEYVRIEILDIEEIGESHDNNTLISSDFLKEYGAADVEYVIDLQNDREPGEDTGTLVKDKEIIYCGETDYYVEYSGRYTDCQSLYENNVLVTYNIPRAYRFVYMKTFAMCNYDNGYRVMLLGELNKDYVQQQLDYFMIGADYHTTIYRQTEETEDSYIYTYYSVCISGGDWGIDDEVVLCKETIKVDKETHILYFDYSESIKSVVIPGTAPSCYEEY